MGDTRPSNAPPPPPTPNACHTKHQWALVLEMHTCMGLGFYLCYNPREIRLTSCTQVLHPIICCARDDLAQQAVVKREGKYVKSATRRWEMPQQPHPKHNSPVDTLSVQEQAFLISCNKTAAVENIVDPKGTDTLEEETHRGNKGRIQPLQSKRDTQPPHANQYDDTRQTHPSPLRKSRSVRKTTA